MRSERLLCTGLLCTVAFLASCDKQAARIKDICDGLIDCSQHASGFLSTDADKAACQEQLRDALEDRRLTGTELTRCASCTREHAPGEDDRQTCEDLLTDRDCDSACAEVSFVLDTRTTREARQRMCRALEREGCGTAQSFDSCEEDLERAFAVRVDFEARLALDIEVRRCADCVTPRALEVSDASVAPLDAGEFDLDSCDRILDNCTSVCSQVSRLSARLNRAQASLTYCNKVQGCTLTPEVVPAQSLPTATCFERALTLPDSDARQLEGCAGCAGAQLDCSSVSENCAECAPLQRAESIAQRCRERNDADPTCETMVASARLDAASLLFCERSADCAFSDEAATRVVLSVTECMTSLLRFSSWPEVRACGVCLQTHPQCDAAQQDRMACEQIDRRLQAARVRSILCDRVLDCLTADASASNASLTTECGTPDDDAMTMNATNGPDRLQARAECSRCAQLYSDCEAIQLNCSACKPESL